MPSQDWTVRRTWPSSGCELGVNASRWRPPSLSSWILHPGYAFIHGMTCSAGLKINHGKSWRRTIELRAETRKLLRYLSHCRFWSWENRHVAFSYLVAVFRISTATSLYKSGLALRMPLWSQETHAIYLFNSSPIGANLALTPLPLRPKEFRLPVASVPFGVGCPLGSFLYLDKHTGGVWCQAPPQHALLYVAPLKENGRFGGLVLMYPAEYCKRGTGPGRGPPFWVPSNIIRWVTFASGQFYQ